MIDNSFTDRQAEIDSESYIDDNFVPSKEATPFNPETEDMVIKVEL